ncbi:MAG: hypothetical protein AAGF85_03945 [Bacteroidota bacterium]
MMDKTKNMPLKYANKSQALSQLIVKSDKNSKSTDGELVFFDTDKKSLAPRKSFQWSLKKAPGQWYKLYPRSIARIDWVFPYHDQENEKLVDIRVEGKTYLDVERLDIFVRFFHQSSDAASLKKLLNSWKASFNENDRTGDAEKYVKGLITYFKDQARTIGLKLNISHSITNKREDFIRSSSFEVPAKAAKDEQIFFSIDYLMELEDLTRYLDFANQDQTMESYLRSHLHAVMEKMLFQISYSDLVSNFDRVYAAQIRTKLLEKIAGAGYSPKILNISIKDLIKGFSVELDGQVEFKTRSSDLQLKVVMDVSADFKDYSHPKVSRLVSVQSTSKINNRIRTEIQNQLSRLVGKWEPESIHPEVSDGTIESQSHKQLIESHITDFLNDKYSLTALKVNVRALNFYASKLGLEIRGLVTSIFDKKQNQIAWLEVNGKARASKETKHKINDAIRLLSDADGFHNQIREWIKGYGEKRRRGEIAQFRGGLEVMEQYLIQQAAQEGISLIVSLKEFGISDAEVPLEETVTATIEGAHEVLVENHMMLRLDKSDLFLKSEISDVESWARDRLRSIIKRNLINKNYIDLLLDFEKKYRFEIETEMKLEASQIGYLVDQIILIPKLDELSFRTGFSFEIGTKEKEEFATRSSEVKVGLEIPVNGRIEDFNNENVRNYIRPGDPEFLISKMKQRVIETTRLYIHGVDPERCIMRFREDENGSSVEEELVERIREVLESEFSASGLYIIPKYTDTELSRRYKNLIKQIHRVRVKTFNQMVDFHVGFRVIGIHGEGWHTFQGMQYKDAQEELNEIGELIRKKMELYLNTILPSDFVDVKNLEFISNIEELADMAAAHVLENLGMLLKITDLEVNETEIDRLRTKKYLQTIQDANDEIDHTSKKLKSKRKYEADTLEKAFQKKQDLLLGELDMDEDDPEVEKLSGIIKDHQATTPKSDLLKQIDKTGSKKQVGLSDALKSLAGSKNKQLSSPQKEEQEDTDSKKDETE